MHLSAPEKARMEKKTFNSSKLFPGGAMKELRARIDCFISEVDATAKIPINFLSLA